ncbi:MAG: C-terminal binding protein [Bacteroidota bacterium]
MNAKVVITDWGFPSLDPERGVLKGKGVDLLEYQCKSEEDVIRVVGDADVVMAQWAPVRANAIAAMTRCKGIVRYGIGLDNIDLDAARRKGIPVRNVPDYCVEEVADHTMALALAVQRQVVSVFQRLKEGTWKITPPLALPPLRHSVLGLIGFGRIGRLVAERARAFGMTVIVSDPVVLEADLRQAGATPASFDRIIRESDVISLHCPLNEKTRHLINGPVLKQMKSTAILVNTSRGGLVDLDAVVEALRAGVIAGAAIDVFEQEPLPAGHQFLTLPNAVATSHIAWYSTASIQELQRRAALLALELLQKQPDQ